VFSSETFARTRKAYLHRHTSFWGLQLPELGKAIFRAIAKFVGPAEKKYFFFYLVNKKMKFIPYHRDKVLKIRFLLIIGWGESGKAILNEIFIQM